MGLLMLAAAMAATTVTAGWTDIPHGETVPGPDGRPWQLVNAPADRLWRVRCASKPHRIALLQDGRVQAADSSEEPVHDDGAWTFAPSTLPPTSWWLLDGAQCGVRVQTLHTSAALLDELEHRVDNAWNLRLALEAADAFAWEDRHALALDHGPPSEWWSRYLAIRPLGGGAVPRASQPYGPRIDAELTEDAPDAWQVGQWAVRGPASVHIDARALGIEGPETICLTLDGPEQIRSCIDTEPRTAMVQTEAGLARAPHPLPEHSTSRRLAWRVYVPRGVHTLAFERPVAARIRTADTGFLRHIEPMPLSARVLPLVDDLPADRWQAARTTTELPTVSILAPANRAATLPSDSSWLPLDALPDVPWADPFGHLRLLLQPSEEPCAVQWGDSRFTTAETGTIQVFSAREPDALHAPTTDGCRAMMRVLGPLEEDAPRHVLAPSWVVGPGMPLDLDLPDAPRSKTLLQVYLQADAPDATVTLVGTSTRELHLSASGPTTAFDLDGTALHDAISLRWTEPTVRIRSDQPLRLRAIQPGRVETVEAPEDAATSTNAPPPTTTDGGSLQAVRALTTTLAHAGDHDRASLLERRARLLLELGRPDLAWRDLEAAAPLDPSLSSGGPALTARAGLIGQLWPTSVLPLGGSWVPGDLDAELAARGEFTALARAAERPEDRARYWIEAARTQVPDATAPIEAMTAILDAGLDPDGPGLSPIRGWSHWRRLSGLHNARLSRVQWAPEVPDPLTDALFVDDWPQDGTRVQPGRYDLVRWPAGGSTDVRVRCRARSSNVETCGLQQLDLVGDTLHSWTLPTDGRSHSITLPANAESTFLQPVRDRDVALELRAPTDLADSLERSVWRTDGTASFHILGPTIIEVEARGSGVMTLQTGSERSSATLSREGAILRLPVRQSGTARVSIQAPSNATFVARALIPGGSPLEPPGHMSLLRGLRGDAPAEAIADAPVLLPSDPRPHAPVPPAPSQPTIAVLGTTSVGYGGSLTVDPLTGTFVGWGGQQRIGVQGRPWRTPLWISGELRFSESSFFASVAEGRIGGEGWWLKRPIRLWAIADGMVRGATQPGLPAVMEGRMSAGVGWLPRKEVELRLSATGSGATRIGAWQPFKGPPLPEPLWTAYRETHRTTWSTRLELRVHPSKWLRVRGWGSLLGNDGRDPQPLDGFLAMAGLRATAPWLRGSVAAGWTQRFPDAHRDRYTGSLALRGSIRGTAYTRDAFTVQVTAEAGWWPQWNRFGAEAGLRVVWAPRDGLADLRPSEEDVRQVAVWGRSER